MKVNKLNLTVFEYKYSKVYNLLKYKVALYEKGLTCHYTNSKRRQDWWKITLKKECFQSGKHKEKRLQENLKANIEQINELAILSLPDKNRGISSCSNITVKGEHWLIG